MQELRGMPVVKAITEQVKSQIARLSEKDLVPRLAVVRVGGREDDIAYEKGIIKRFDAAGAAVSIIALPAGVKQDVLEETILNLNQDSSVDGILVFRPLPGHLSEARIKDLIDRTKDVDGMGTVNNAYVYEGNQAGYAPCTAQAVIETLDFYGIALTGKRVTIIGRSLVVGKPLAMLLLNRNATITVCHTRTVCLAGECRKAEILIACAGSAGMVGADFTHPEQIIIDVGINVAGGKLCGDVDAAAVAEAAALSPVPGGIGTVTTSVLLKNTVNSAMLKILPD